MKSLLAGLALAFFGYLLYKFVGRLFWGAKEKTETELLAEAKVDAQNMVGIIWKFLDADRETMADAAIVSLEGENGLERTIFIESCHPDFRKISAMRPGQKFRFDYDESGVVSVPTCLATSFLRLAK